MHYISVSEIENYIPFESDTNIKSTRQSKYTQSNNKQLISITYSWQFHSRRREARGGSHSPEAPAG